MTPSPESPPPPRPPRLTTFEAWWAFFFRVICGIGGLAILIGQAFQVANGQLALTVAGIGLCGPVVAAAAGSFIETTRGSK